MHALALGSAFVAGLLLPAQESAPATPKQPSARSTPLPSAFRFDGDLAEWSAPPDLVLDQPGQIWRHSRAGDWLGPDDLSAQFWVRHDVAHLYVAGRIRDDSLVTGSPVQPWESADAVELFFDFDLHDDAGVEGQRRFDSDDLQLFLMPLSVTRPWGAVDFVSARAEGREARPNPFGMSGIRVLHRVLDGVGYSFEAILPLHNFPALVPGTEMIGFHVAIDDWDRGRERYQYMTWSGQNSVDDTRYLGRLHADEGGFLADPRARGRSWLTSLADYTPFVLVPCLVGALVWLLVRGWRSAQRQVPALRNIGRVLAIALFLTGLLLPGFVLGLRESSHAAQCRDVVSALQADIPKMQRGTLASYTGQPRDRALVALLGGGQVERKRSFEHRFLTDLIDPAAPVFGGGRKIYPAAFDRFPVQPYWVPLPLEQGQRLELGSALVPGYLAVVISLPAGAVPAPAASAPAPRVRVVFGGSGSAGPSTTQDVDFTAPLESASAFNQARRTMTFERVAVPPGVSSITLTALRGDEMQLVGLTSWPEAGGAPRPLPLGQTALGGIRTDLRAGHPEDAGVELYPGSAESRERVVPLARDHATAYQKLWLIYRARFPARGGVPLELAPGTEVAKVTITFRGNEPERVVSFEHQSSVLFEMVRYNAVDAPQDESTSIAFRWEDQEQEPRINLIREIDLPEGAVVDALRFENTGPYEIRFRSAVFGLAQDEIPFDLTDSPLELVDRGRRVALKGTHLQALQPAGFTVYRDGRLIESTLTGAARIDRAVLPRAVARGLRPEQPLLLHNASGDARSYEAYLTLPGEGTAGAVLHVSIDDPEHGVVARRLTLVAFGCCLLSAPVLLLLLAELIVAIRNLRLRLLTVLGVATLTPLAVLSLVLVQVLETRHENEVRGNLTTALGTASRQLRERQEQIGVAAESWHPALLAEIEGLRGSVDPKRLEAARARIEKLLQSQLPPDWQSGYLRFEAVPTPGAVAPTLTVAHGDPSLWAFETQLRPRPAGLYFSWGVPVLGVYVEKTVARWNCRLSVMRRFDESVLTGLAPNHATLLTDLRGYPLVAVGGPSLGSAELLDDAVRPAALDERRAAVAQILDGGQPFVGLHRGGTRGLIATYELQKDRHDSPRALLGVVDVDLGPQLPLPFGSVPLRGFFVAGAGVLILLSVFLSFYVATRVSRPIERLERGARALSAGVLDVRVPVEEGGEIGRLTATFNQMAQGLRERIHDLHSLNRGIVDLTSRLDVKEVVASARAFCARHSPADAVRVLLRERERVELVGHGQLDPQLVELRAILRATGPFSMRFAEGSALAAACPGHRSAVGLPLLLGGRTTGAILLLFENPIPAPVNLDLLATVAAQTAATLENARLYRHAVEDVETGALLPEPFRRLAEREVAAAEAKGQSVALLRLRIAGHTSLAADLGAPGWERFLERFVAFLRQTLPPDAQICRAEHDDLQLLLPAHGKTEALAAVSTILARVGDVELGLPQAALPLQLEHAEAVYPAEAASAEFLFHALGGTAEERAPAASLRRRLQNLRDSGIVLSSPPMQAVLRTLERVAPSELTVLLEGETGTGKEVLADLVHAWSRRAAGPLVKVHCAALTETLLQSELFGHEKGAFTGAIARKQGRFELAHGGTIFLDEVGEISLDMQVKLLRVLQQREVERVGGSEPVPVDVRVVAATNRELRAMVAAGTFREDLYYRLLGVAVQVPPLRERRQEIPELVEAFRREAVAAGHTRVVGFSAEALDELYRRDWPGNVRELRNLVFRAMVLATGDLVKRSDLLGTAPEVDEAAAVTNGSGRDRSLDEPNAAAPAAPAEPTVLVPAELPARLRRLHALLESRGQLSTQDYVIEAGVSPRTGLRDLNQLVALGFAQRVGTRRGARYRRQGAANSDGE